MIFTPLLFLPFNKIQEAEGGVAKGAHSIDNEVTQQFNELMSLANTPIDKNALAKHLATYESPDATILLDGFQNGFRLHYTGPRHPRESKNLKSARELPDIITDKIQKEVTAGRMAGPFISPPLPNLIVSPIGLVPKKSPGEYRMIHHLSHPRGSSINDHIDSALCSVQYTSFDEAIYMTQEFGRGCKLFKMDLKNAFRLLPVHPQDFELLGLRCNQGFYYFDKALPFGASICCSTFEKFATFLEYFVKSRMKSGKLIHYLDDYLGCDRNVILCRQLMSTFLECLNELKVPIAEEKTEGPTEVIVFLGLELDSNEMVVRIPRAKIDEVVTKILTMLAREKSTLKEMQSLIGSLNFCCRAIAIGRPFCRRLINSTCGLTKGYHHIRVSKEIKLDLNMWLHFFTNYNGISVFHDRFWSSNDDIQLFTDSAGGEGLGFGIFFQGHWCYSAWPDAWHKDGITNDITILELFPIVVATCIWGEELRNKRIRFNCDNMSVVHILNTMTSKSDKVMCLVRFLTLKCLQVNIIVRASHLPGSKNVICDALSRLQLDRFKEMAPDADPEPTQVPTHLWNIFTSELKSFF